jgi:hypothetical protein
MVAKIRFVTRLCAPERPWMWSRASRRSTSLRELRSFGSADQTTTTTAAAGVQVGRIRQAPGLAPASGGVSEAITGWPGFQHPPEAEARFFMASGVHRNT